MIVVGGLYSALVFGAFCIQVVTPVLPIDQIIEHANNVGIEELHELLEARHTYKTQGTDVVKDSSTEHQIASLALPTPVSASLERLGILGIRAAKEIEKLTDGSLDTFFTPEVREQYQEAYELYFRSQYSQPKPTCNPNSKYRTMDGSCNNLNNPLWGMAETAQPRFLKPAYDDGIDTPRQTGSYDLPLPSARQVSNALFKGSSAGTDSKKTTVHMAWGQFLDHDIVATPRSIGEDGTDITCCGVPDPRPECFIIEIPINDPDYDRKCMHFVRSQATLARDFFPGPRQQLNEITSYIDASMVYGSSDEASDSLRTFQDGKLKSEDCGRLPKADLEDCFKDKPSDFCQVAGDGRVNEIPNLGSLHSLLMREHNRIVGELKKVNPDWDDATLFQEGRKIVGAIVQHITYSEYLPALLGNDYMHIHGLDLGSNGFAAVYDDTVDASIRNAFGSAVFRFGHSQIPSVIERFDKNKKCVETRPLNTCFFHTHMCTHVQKDEAKLEGVLRWLISSKGRDIDRHFENSIRNKLFPDDDGNSLDLASLNIQRGRDHGIPSYNEWREFCGLNRAETFFKSNCGLSDHSKANAYLLSLAYRHPDDIDLYAGGMTEEPIEGGSLGPTFSCILRKQFQALKFGDRFWYENDLPNSGFTEDQVNEIKKVTLSKVICDNIDVDKVQANSFLFPGKGNSLCQCSEFQGIDFQFWQVSVTHSTHGIIIQEVAGGPRVVVSESQLTKSGERTVQPKEV